MKWALGCLKIEVNFKMRTIVARHMKYIIAYVVENDSTNVASSFSSHYLMREGAVAAFY